MTEQIIAVKIAYSGRVSQTLIKQIGLFSAKEIKKLIQENDITEYLGLLQADKQSYNSNDLAEMKELADVLNNLPDQGKIEEVKGGLFSSGGMKYICVCGNKNPYDLEHCEMCDRNIKGLTRREVRMINDYLTKVDTLEEILS